MTGHSKAHVDLKQQLMIAIYLANICLAYLRLGIVLSRGLESTNADVLWLDAALHLLAYHCIMFLASALHTTPKRNPYNYVFWCMRIIALLGFVSEVYIVHGLTVAGSGRGEANEYTVSG